MGNLEIRQFKLAITEFINKNSLPAEVKRLVISEIKHEVDHEADRQVVLEAKGEEHEKDIQQN